MLIDAGFSPEELAHFSQEGVPDTAIVRLRSLLNTTHLTLLDAGRQHLHKWGTKAYQTDRPLME